MFDDQPVGAWRLRGADVSDGSHKLSNGDTRPRVALSLAEVLPTVPTLRRGCAVVDLEVEALLADS